MVCIPGNRVFRSDEFPHGESIGIKSESRRHHAHDSTRLVVQLDLLADNILLSTECTLPETVLQNHGARSIEIIGLECAPELGRNAEERKELDADRHGKYVPCGSPSSQNLSTCCPGTDGELLETAASAFPGFEIAIAVEYRRSFSVVRGYFPDHNQPIRIFVGKRAEENCIDDAEDGCIRANG